MELWSVGITALVATWCTSPAVRRWLLHNDLLDRPNARSSHNIAVPRGGGIACAVGLASAGVVAYTLGHSPPWTVIFAAVTLATVGFVDDRRGLHAVPRLLAQLTVGALVGLIAGGPVWAILGSITLAATVNAVNFMDGLNGISALHFSLWGVAACLAAATQGLMSLAAVGAITAGLAVGFLPFNFPNAHMFLGDVGSYLFGAIIGSTVILGIESGVDWIALVTPFTLYVVDTTITLLRRAVRGASVLSPHREHVYQRLVSTGQLSHGQASAFTAALSALIYLSSAQLRPVLAGTVVTLATLLYLASPAVLSLAKRSTQAGGRHP